MEVFQPVPPSRHQYYKPLTSGLMKNQLTSGLTIKKIRQITMLTLRKKYLLNEVVLNKDHQVTWTVVVRGQKEALQPFSNIIWLCTYSSHVFTNPEFSIYSLISIRQIYICLNYAIKWRMTVCWFLDFYPFLTDFACWEHKIVLHI